MSNDSAVDLEELFQLEEETTDEQPKETITEKAAEKPEEGDAESNQDEPKTEPADAKNSKGTKRKSSGVSRAAKQSGDKGESSEDAEEVPAGRVKEAGVTPDVWSKNIIGTPKGRVNPYFEGVVSHDGYDGRQILIPFKDITIAQRQIYVDDIHIENPTILHTIYRVQGSFPDVLARVTEEVFNQVLKHPEIKLKKVNYSWVSDHRSPRRNYIVDHDSRPTLEELKKIDKHQDEVEWALMPWYEREKLKKEDKKYENMPKDEEVPLPTEEEATETESETEQPEEE